MNSSYLFPTNLRKVKLIKDKSNISFRPLYVSLVQFIEAVLKSAFLFKGLNIIFDNIIFNT